jgi:hypothetical protein
MSLKQIAAEKLDKLHVARLYGCNMQLSGGNTATPDATAMQRHSLKALIANGSACNKPCNYDATPPEKHMQLLPPETPSKVASVAEGIAGSCTPVSMPENQPAPEQKTDAAPDISATKETPPALSFQPIVASGDSPANDPDHTVIDRQRTFLKREPLVSQEDLHQIQRHLLRHLTDCRDCCIEDHLYCTQAERTGNGYTAYLTEFPDAAQRHADYVAVVIQSRIRGLQAGFRALDALAHQERDAGRETPSMPVYGIDKRPAELAFVNHFTACAYCFPRSGKYCAEGRVLHDMALLETLQ